MKIGYMIAVILFANSMPYHGHTQKLWDGEAGDNQWYSTRNWFPDGVPLITDYVKLNNEIVKNSFVVLLPPTIYTTELASIDIRSSNGYAISLHVPETNTASPALSLKDIIIGNGGIFINNSGASAGNPLLIKNNLKIENGGRYIHRTIRGNAYLVSKLLISPETQHGIFEFDVPGTSGYTISLSNKEYGGLIFNANKAGGKKTYSGSGNGTLRVYGDLITEAGASFISSLIGNIYVRGNLSNKGSISLNPVSSDTIARQFIFEGDSSNFYSTGVFSMNSFLRKMVVAPRASLKLLSPLMMSNPNNCFDIKPLGVFNPNQFFIQGGSFFADSASIIQLSSIDGISNDKNIGSLRADTLHFHKSVAFQFTGDQQQKTGDAFPNEISRIHLLKSAGNLTLTKSLHVKDSMELIHGKIIGNAQCILSFSGKKIIGPLNEYGWNFGNTQSFIEGPFIYYSDTTTMLEIPIGKNEIFAPIQVSIKSITPISCRVEYFSEQTPYIDQQKIYPLKNIGKNEYWTFKKNYENNNSEQKESISTSLRSMNSINITEQPVVANFIAIDAIWKAIPTSINNQSTKFLTSIYSDTKNGILTFGTLEALALPFGKITLQQVKKETSILLTWEYDEDRNVDFYQVEESADGKKFFLIKKILSLKKSTNYSYQYENSVEKIGGKFIRVTSNQKDDKKHASNILYIKPEQINHRIFPNPSNEKVYIPMYENNATIKIRVLDSNGKTFVPLFTREGNRLAIDIKELPKGIYTLRYSLGNNEKSVQFVKY